MALLSMFLSKFLMNTFPTPDLRNDGSRCDHIIRIGRDLSTSKFMVSKARSAILLEKSIHERNKHKRIEMRIKIIAFLTYISCIYKIENGFEMCGLFSANPNNLCRLFLDKTIEKYSDIQPICGNFNCEQFHLKNIFSENIEQT